jgi:hypothetical protein
MQLLYTKCAYDSSLTFPKKIPSIYGQKGYLFLSNIIVMIPIMFNTLESDFTIEEGFEPRNFSLLLKFCFMRFLAEY